MSELKLARLPDRTPVKVTLSIMPDLHDRLVRYAAAYREAYGHAETLSELMPAMLAAFMDSDRAFVRKAAVS